MDVIVKRPYTGFRKWLMWSVWGFLLVFLCVLMSFMPLQHDDYGYAILGYVYEEPDVLGQNFTFIQLIHYLWMHYQIWGGRILAIFLEILSFKMGLRITQIITAVVIWGTLKLIDLMVNRGKWYYSVIVAIGCICLFGGLQQIAIDGIYWYSACFGYMYPTFYMILGGWLLNKILNNQGGATSTLNIILIALVTISFLAGWSMEHMGAATILLYILVLANYLKDNENIVVKKVVYAIASLVSVGIGYLALMIAPGNMMRASVYPDYYGLPVFLRVSHGIKNVLSTMFGPANQQFAFTVILVGAAICFWNLRTKSKFLKIVSIITLGLSVSLFVLLESSSWIKYVLAGFFVIGIMIVVVSWLWKCETEYDRLILALFISSVASQGAFVVSPIYPLRSMVVFGFIWILLTVRFIVDVVENWKQEHGKILKTLTCICMSTMLVVNLLSMAVSFNAYFINGQVYKYNDQILREASRLYKETGQDPNGITLMKVKYEEFSGTDPYERDIIKLWMKEYYEFPQDWSEENIQYREYNPELLISAEY